MAMDDDYSDLTDIDDQDDDFEASKSTNKRGTNSSVANEYRIQYALKVARATTYTAQALYDQIHASDIKLDPEYQRDVVWPDAKMIGLIDSVFRNFYVPPVIFSVSTSEDGTEKKICIDGKQRLTSIQRFMDGLIPHKDPVTSDKLWYIDDGTGGRTRKRLLPDKYRKAFANKQIVCVEYTDLKDRDEREIFQRVQLGMALTPAEKLQVINTPRAVFVRSLVAHFLSLSSDPDPNLPSTSQGSLAEFDWERGRGADFRSFTQIIYCLYAIHHSPSSSPPKIPKGSGTITQIEKFLQNTVPFEEDFQAMVRNAFRILGDMAQDGGYVKDVFKTPTKLAPVEFVMVGVLVGMHMEAAGFRSASDTGTGKSKESDKTTEQQARRVMAKAIQEMRTQVRAIHVDIRNNDRVSKTLLEYIISWTPGENKPPLVSTNSTGAKGDKRKRGEEMDVDEGEEGEAGATPQKKISKRSSATATTNARPRTPPTPLSMTMPRPLPQPKPTTAAAPASRPSLPTPIPLPKQRSRLPALRAAQEHLRGQAAGAGAGAATTPHQ